MKWCSCKKPKLCGHKPLQGGPLNENKHYYPRKSHLRSRNVMVTTVLKRSDVDYFLQHLNAQQPTVLFRKETKNDSTVPFLDTLLHKRFSRTLHYNRLPATAIFHTPDNGSNFFVGCLQQQGIHFDNMIGKYDFHENRRQLFVK